MTNIGILIGKLLFSFLLKTLSTRYYDFGTTITSFNSFVYSDYTIVIDIWKKIKLGNYNEDSIIQEKKNLIFTRVY